MALRRIVEYCPELRYKLDKNETGDQVCGGTVCGKELQIVCETELLDYEGFETGYLYQIFKCGHSREIKKETWEHSHERNILWDRLLAFQKTSVEFTENAGLCVALNHEMGLGKTIIANSVIRENADRMLPCIIICQSGDIFRWQEECMKWFGLEMATDFEHFNLMPQVYCNPKQQLSPISQVVIVPWTRIGEKNFTDQIRKLKYRSIVVDEFHMYKSEDSSRTLHLQNLVRICKTNQPNGNKLPFIGLSGTPVVNRVMEWHTCLNILDPQYFTSPRVLKNMCLQSSTGKALTIAPWWREKFFQRTSKYVLRMTKAEVNIPLPKLQSHKQWFHPSEWETNKQFMAEYNKTLEELEKEINGAHPTSGAIIGFMSQLRRLTGLMKVLNAAELIHKFLTNNDEKLCVGVHHVSVREWLCKLLTHWNPLSMSDEKPEIKDEIERKFRNGNRLLIASILSAGQGRNLQFCKNAIILERQWNKAREDQFEQRFHRIKTDKLGRIIDKFNDSDTVNIYYLMARDSFDEYFDELVHLKGLIVDSVDPDVEDLPEEDFIMELARKVVMKRMQYVGG
jgi:SNF2 family DNA or RNA helicase